MKQSTYIKRKLRINRRDKSYNHPGSLRVTFLKTNKHYYASMIDTDTGNVLSSVSTQKASSLNKKSKDRISDLATQFVAKLSDVKDKKIIFDRGVYRFHGLVKHFVDQIRHEGVNV